MRPHIAHHLVGIMGALLTLALGGIVLAQTGGGYDLTWWTVDGGGGTVSGAGYTLMGTAGQPDAGAPLTGGGYTLTGGFWQPEVESTPPLCPDLYEPNEDFADARVIAPGRAIQAYICDANDQDWFKFDVQAGQEITVDLTHLPADYDLELYDAGEANVAGSNNSGTADERVQHTATSAGAYRVRVYGYNGAHDASHAYTLLVQVSGGQAQKTKMYAPLMYKRK